MSNSSVIILITGANSGIGFVTTRIIVTASEQYHVIVAARSIEKAKAAVGEIESQGGIKGTLSIVQLVVTDQSSIDKAVSSVQERFGRLDVLVNNAGSISRDPDFTKAAMETYHVNSVAPAVMSMAFRDLLLKSQNPYSIFVSSGMGSAGLASDKSDPCYGPDVFHYRMSKAALNMWAIQEHKVMAKEGLKVFPICPGSVASNLRGTRENPGDGLGDPVESGRLILSIIEGKRDADVGSFVHKEGIYPW